MEGVVAGLNRVAAARDGHVAVGVQGVVGTVQRERAAADNHPAVGLDSLGAVVGAQLLGVRRAAVRPDVERAPGNRHVARRLYAVALGHDCHAPAVDGDSTLRSSVVAVRLGLDSVAVRRDVHRAAVDNHLAVGGNSVVGGLDVQRQRAFDRNRRLRRALDSVLAGRTVGGQRTRARNRQRRARFHLNRRALEVVALLVCKALFVGQRHRADCVERNSGFLVARQRGRRTAGKRQVLQNQRDARRALLHRDTAFRASTRNRVDARLLNRQRRALDFVAAFGTRRRHAAVGKCQRRTARRDAYRAVGVGRPRDPARIRRVRDQRHGVQKGRQRDGGNHRALESQLFHGNSSLIFYRKRCMI